MNPDTTPKPVSKSALHRRRSSSGDRTISTSVTTDLDPTASLSLSFSNLGDFAPQSHLDNNTPTNKNDGKEHTTYNTHINNNKEHSKNATDTGRANTPNADTDDRDGGSLAQYLNLLLPDLVATRGPLGAPPPSPPPGTAVKKHGIAGERTQNQN